MKKIIEAVKQIIATFRVNILYTAKAWVALIVSAGVLFLADKGIIIPEDVEDSVVFAIVGIITAVLVYFVPNTQKK